MKDLIQMAQGKLGKVVVLRLKPGADVLLGLTEACKEAGWDCDDCNAVGTCDCVDCGVGSHFKWRGISPGYNTNMQ